jgi:SCAN domain-containing zinc finger protein
LLTEETVSSGRSSASNIFRQFCYQDSPGPCEALRQLQELCCQWLKPKTHSRKQILELLVLEQFLTILPEPLQAWVYEHYPDSGEEAGPYWKI